MVGSPIAHSLAPVLHRAAYRALGLHDWEYHREEVAAGELRAYLATRPASWVGVSVTMPGKEEALAVADERSVEAQRCGAANTLVRVAGGWAAHNTDIDGVVAALREAGCLGTPRRAWVGGSGATARSALVALRAMGVEQVLVQVRGRPRPATLKLGAALGMDVVILVPGADPAPGVVDVAVSTVPAGAVLEVPRTLDLSGCPALDVVYAPRPTPWSQQVQARGAVVVDGSRMLLHQAARQVQLMTGRAAPLEQMGQALHDALSQSSASGAGER